MSFIAKLFKNEKSKENIEAHEVVEQKSAEAHDILNEVQGKLLQITNEIEAERKRSSIEMEKSVKQIRDAAQQIAIVTGGVS